MPKLEACANKTYTGISTTSTCRDRPKLKTKLLLSFGKTAIFFHDVYSYMPKLEACANKTYTGILTTSTCRDRPQFFIDSFATFQKKCYS